jgi:hypothetical protein
MKPLPVIQVTATTVVTHASAPWRRWVTVRRGFSRALVATHVFDQPYHKIARGEAARRDWEAGRYTWAPVLDEHRRTPWGPRLRGNSPLTG